MLQPPTASTAARLVGPQAVPGASVPGPQAVPEAALRPAAPETGPVPKTGPAKAALEKPRKYEADFNFRPAKKVAGEDAGEDVAQLVGKKRQGKYFVPTEANWGPKPRATGGKRAKTTDGDAAEEK